MFVKMKAIHCVTIGLALAGGTLAAQANDSKGAEIPLTVTLTDVRAGDVPLYISIQTEETYRSMKGEGGIVEATSQGDLTRTFNLKKPGDYAVSIWHDLDGDGRFSMNERYEIQDGWGSSGQVPRGSQPSFEQAKVSVPQYGASTTIEMIYPDA